MYETEYVTLCLFAALCCDSFEKRKQVSIRKGMFAL